MIYIFSKIFTAFFLPPGLFITILAALALFVKKFRWLLASTAVLFYALSIHPIADRLLSHYETPYKNTHLPLHADAVVTLGGGNIRGNPIPLIDEAFKRHIYGLAIARRLDIPMIVSGTGDGGYNEFQGLLDSLRTLRPILADDLNVSTRYVDHFAIIPETQSSDTFENAKYSIHMIEKENPTIILVTSAYHMTRALRLFRLAGVEHLYPAAVNFYIDDTKPTDWRDFVPSMWALLNSYRALHEFFGLLKVRLREIAG
ncbi:YdcF family protein [Hydrogenimonas sp.]|uniref:YdcF family protein n=1 Tax=Hydrogenimonas sp. TaxID=2231112 RepID=UPI00260E9CB5|nr:YdcF family protein [Hydrogenimonas sp.]